MRGCWIFLLAALTLLIGCGKADVAEAGEDSKRSYEPMVRQFGEAVQRGDWAAAYAMTTPEFQGTTSQAQLQDGYQKLVSEIQQDEPSYKANVVDVDFGDLPSNEEEAAKYGIKSIPPRSSWKAWACASIGQGDANSIERGIDAWMLVTEQGRQAKLSHVEFMFMD